MSAPRPIPRWLPFAVHCLGVLAGSCGAILVRLAQGQGMPSLTVASLRLGLAAVVLVPFAGWRVSGELRALTRRQAGLAAGAGFCLALHFAAWISSLEYTSIASSTALVTTNPLWIALISFFLPGERLSRMSLAGIAVSLLGSAMIFWSDRHQDMGEQALLGNFLALAGSWCFSAYLLIGRRVRARMPLLAYIFLAYAAAALFLLLMNRASGAALLGYGMPAYLAVFGLALGPQLLGHTAYNWSLRHVSPTFVAIAALGEPVGSASLAWLLFGESLALLQGGGFVLLLLGIYLAAREEGGRIPDARMQHPGR